CPQITQISTDFFVTDFVTESKINGVNWNELLKFKRLQEAYARRSLKLRLSYSMLHPLNQSRFTSPIDL
ncbi:MAG: hypothetical protein LC643_02310, partial [Bacteroidales bacterium]|nr:hypothetical protein [Bacteroidales bacterium]